AACQTRAERCPVPSKQRGGPCWTRLLPQTPCPADNSGAEKLCIRWRAFPPSRDGWKVRLRQMASTSSITSSEGEIEKSPWCSNSQTRLNSFPICQLPNSANANRPRRIQATGDQG